MMQLQLLALTSIWTIVQCTLGPHMPFLPMLHSTLLGPELAFHDPMPPFLPPGLSPPLRPFPRRILIIRAPPGARFPFGESHRGGLLRPLPDGLIPRQLRRFRPLQFGPRLPGDMGLHPISLSKYGYERPDFHDMDVVRRQFRHYRDRRLLPSERDWMDRYPMFHRRERDRYTDISSDYYRDRALRFGRRRGRNFPRDFLGISRRFDSPGAVRRAIPEVTKSGFSERISTRHEIDQRRGVSRRKNLPGKNSIASRRRGARRGRGQMRISKKRSKANRPIFKAKQTSEKGPVKSSSEVLDMTKPVGSIVAKKGAISIKVPDANVVDLTLVNVPGETNDIVNSGVSGPVDKGIIDLTHLDQEGGVLPSLEITNQAILQPNTPAGNAIKENLQPAVSEPEPLGIEPSANLEPPSAIFKPDVTLTGAEPLSAPHLTVADNSQAGAADVIGAVQSLKADPLAPEVSIVELGGSGTLPSDLIGLGSVDVLTLSKEGFTALEKAIQSGKTINADVLNSIIGKGGASDVSGSGTAAGPDIVVIDHPSAGHTSTGHVEHVVDAGTSTAKHVHAVESKVPSIARATTVLSPEHSGHSMSDISASSHDPAQHGPHKANIVGVVGESVGAVEATGATDVLGIFTVPSNSNFPKVPKSVSVIPSSIGQLLNGVSKDHVAHKVH